MVRQMVRPKCVQAILPAGPLPLSSANVPTGISKIEDLNTSTLHWHRAARVEWRSLLGELDEFNDPRFRWAPAPGPLADKVPESIRTLPRHGSSSM